MTAVTAETGHTPTVSRTAHVTFLRTLRAEWVKLFSVRSTAWVLGISVLVMVGFSLMMATGFSMGASNPEMTGGEPVPADPMMGTMAATFGYSIGQIVFVVLGVMRISGEYTTGRIRSTLAAVPTDPAARERRRRQVVAGGYPIRRRDHAQVTIVAMGLVVLIAYLARRVAGFWQHLKQGVAILRQPRRYLREVVAWQALGWILRFASL